MLTQLKKIFLVSLLTVMVAACSTAAAAGTQSQITNPYAPQAGDAGLVQGDVRLVKTEILKDSSSPAQFSVKLSFFKPTPCDEFRVAVTAPDANHQVLIQVYSLMKPGTVCTLMATLNPTEAVIGLGSLPIGHYTVVVNGSPALDFDVS